MADWDEEEAKYLANPEKYIENLGKKLDLQRESETRSEVATQNNIKLLDLKSESEETTTKDIKEVFTKLFLRKQRNDQHVPPGQ